MAGIDSKIVLMLFVVILVAGCTTTLPTFGLDAISINKETSVEGERNVLVIKDKLSIPKSPVLTDQSVQFSFILENKDVAKPAKVVEIDLFDAPLMKKSLEGPLCTLSGQKNCVPRGCAPGQKCVLSDILPGEQRQILVDMYSPSHPQIGGLKTDLKLNFLVKYNFEGSTSFTVPVVNVEEITARQRAGDKIKVDVVKSIGSGPIQVDPELFGSSYILAGQSGTLLFVIKNKGKGNLPLSKVPPRKLCIYFPLQFFDDKTTLVSPDGIAHKAAGRAEESGSGTGGIGSELLTPDIFETTGFVIGSDRPLVTGYAAEPSDENNYGCYSDQTKTCTSFYTYSECPDKCSGSCVHKSQCPAQQPQQTAAEKKDPLFECVPVASASADCHDSSKGVENTLLCYNVRGIDLFRDESRVSMRFSLHKVKAMEEPFKSMTILAKIKYPYELRDSFEITVIPARE